MPILLRNLDDRRWQDLVDEGRALIPLYGPEWTDHNAHDPGITLVELFAWLAEMDIYQLNRVTNPIKLKFLALVGVTPKPPQPAAVVLSQNLQGVTNPADLPAGVEFSGLDPFGVETRFRTLEAVSVLPGSLVAIQVKDSKGFHDMTERSRRNLPYGAFGDVPELGAELYLGFDKPLLAGQQLSLYFTFTNPHAKCRERQRLIDEATAQQEACIPPENPCQSARKPCQGSSSFPLHPSVALPTFYGVKLTWEVWAQWGATAQWVSPPASAVNDDTRSFTLDGSVRLTLPQNLAASVLGQTSASLYYVRVRFVAGAYDAPPVLQNVAANAVLAEQAVPAGSITWTIAPGATVTPLAPPAAETGLQLQFNSQGQITSLNFVTDPATPLFRVLSFTPPSAATAGSLSIEAAVLGLGDGTPFQKLSLPEAPVQQESFALYTLEESTWRTWRRRADFDASGRADRDFLLDATAGSVSFGDGENGAVLAAGALAFAIYRSTRAEAGNLRAGAITQLADSPHNRALLANFAQAQTAISATNPLNAAGGMAAETLDHAIGRAIELIGEPQRAVTLSDYETLAKETPGFDIARAIAWPDMHPSFPCLKAPGMVTVVVIPNMPVTAPIPSQALLEAVAAYLNRRRLIGTRVQVTGPTYREVTIRAQVQSLTGTSKTALGERVVDSLNSFLNPLTGGPDASGWPFGRDVYRAEMLQVIDGVPGVDYVASLALIADGCECDPQCGNVCVAPTWLVTPGQHEIEVL